MKMHCQLIFSDIFITSYHFEFSTTNKSKFKKIYETLWAIPGISGIRFNIVRHFSRLTKANSIN